MQKDAGRRVKMINRDQREWFLSELLLASKKLGLREKGIERERGKKQSYVGGKGKGFTPGGSLNE